jgi:hypothetical protein
MVDRAEVLELIDRAPGGCRTLHGRWHSWAHAEPMEAAQERAWGHKRLQLSSGDPNDGPTIREYWKDVWFEFPDRWRVEINQGPLDFNSHLAIRDRDSLWRGGPERFTVFDLAKTHTTLDTPLVSETHPGAMLGWLRLGEPTAGEYEGRPVWIVAATARDVSNDLVNAVPLNISVLPGAEHVYTIDSQHGIVYTHSATVDGELCLRVELSGIAVDEPLDPVLFRPPEQAEVETEAPGMIAMLERVGVDASGLDPNDLDAVRAAFDQWRKAREQQAREAGRITLGSHRPEDLPPPSPTPA